MTSDACIDSNNGNIKISVIMSVYNGQEFLSQAVESVLNQSHENIEFVIINDGSTDSSLDIIRDYMRFDNRIVLINQTNMGLTAALNVGVSQATGEYIARQDADDISMPKRFELFFDFVEKNGPVDIYTAPAVLINSNGLALKTIPNYFRRNGFHKKMLNYYNSLIHGTLIIRASIIKRHAYNENFRYAQDFEMYHNLLRHNYKISYDRLNSSYKLRLHNNQISVVHKSPQFTLFKQTLESRDIKFYSQTLLNRLFFRLVDIVLYLKVVLKLG
tara:strand:- start:568 stop:1386 length:819 start_codon:yes stop_codon:yes gene_type:complete